MHQGILSPHLSLLPSSFPLSPCFFIKSYLKRGKWWIFYIYLLLTKAPDRKIDCMGLISLSDWIPPPLPAPFPVFSDHCPLLFSLLSTDDWGQVVCVSLWLVSLNIMTSEKFSKGHQKFRVSELDLVLF